MQQRKPLDELILEFNFFEKKKTEILREAKGLVEKNSSKVRPKEIRSLIGRTKKLTNGFAVKIEAIEKMASKL